MIQITLKFWPLKLPTGGLQNVSIFSAVHEISRTFKMFTPKTSTPPRGRNFFPTIIPGSGSFQLTNLMGYS